jgi:hypothetical protein
VRGVTEKCRATVGPARQRVAIEHRELEDRQSGADPRGDVEPVEVPILERGQEFGERAAAAPARGRGRLVARQRMLPLQRGNPRRDRQIL